VRICKLPGFSTNHRQQEPIVKEILKGELTHDQIAERFSVSVQSVAKLAEELS